MFVARDSVFIERNVFLQSQLGVKLDLDEIRDEQQRMWITLHQRRRHMKSANLIKRVSKQADSTSEASIVPLE